MTAIEMIRVIGTEFSEVSESVLDSWIEIVSPMVSRKQFGNLYTQAIAYLVCHNMKLAGLGEDATGGLAAIGASGSHGISVASVSDGGTSLSFNSGAGAWTFADAELSLTVYGAKYLQLRHMCVVPIHIRGEW